MNKETFDIMMLNSIAIQNCINVIQFKKLLVIDRTSYSRNPL